MKNEADELIRIVNDNEKNLIRPLYEEVFNDSKEFVDYYFAKYVKNAINFVCERNGQVIAMATIHPKTLSISGENVKVGYVYAVATKKEYRGQGLMRNVLEAIDKYAIDNKYAYLYLIPVDPEIYKSLGYVLLKEGKECLVKRTQIHLDNSMEYDLIKLDLKDIKKALDFLMNFYENKVSIYYDENSFSELIERFSGKKSGIYCVFHRECDKILGLALIEDDEDINVAGILCENKDRYEIFGALMNGLEVDKLVCNENPVMFKSVYEDIDKIKNYTIYINDEV